MEEANIEFIQEAMGITLPERQIDVVDIDEKQIKSGDFFLILRLDGLDPMIMYGTGSIGSHCVMAMWYGPELYILESQDAWYWPTAGIQRTPYRKWIRQAREASFNVVWLPLSEESAEKFNTRAAKNWFSDHEGLPYGYHNFLFGWLDTPENNLPQLVPHQMVPILFSMLEPVIAEIDVMYTGGINHRLGT